MSNKSLNLGKITAFEKEFSKAAEKGLDNFCEKVMTDADHQVPVDTGKLRRSARTEKSKSSNKVQIEMSFNTEYAAIQHEYIDFNHPNGGKAHYLSDPLLIMGHSLEEEIAKEAKKGMK